MRYDPTRYIKNSRLSAIQLTGEPISLTLSIPASWSGGYYNEATATIPEGDVFLRWEIEGGVYPPAINNRGYIERQQVVGTTRPTIRIPLRITKQGRTVKLSIRDSQTYQTQGTANTIRAKIYTFKSPFEN